MYTMSFSLIMLNSVVLCLFLPLLPANFVHTLSCLLVRIMSKADTYMYLQHSPHSNLLVHTFASQHEVPAKYVSPWL